MFLFDFLVEAVHVLFANCGRFFREAILDSFCEFRELCQRIIGPVGGCLCPGFCVQLAGCQHLQNSAGRVLLDNHFAFGVFKLNVPDARRI